MDWFLYDNGLCHERVQNYVRDTSIGKKRLAKIGIRQFLYE